MLLGVAVKSRVETIPHFLVSLMGILGLLNIIAFMFLIDYAARLLRPVSIIGLVAEKGLKVIEDVYPRPIRTSAAKAGALKELGPPERTVPHNHSSAIVIAVNLQALVSEATRANVVIEFAPRVGDFVAKDDPLFLLRGAGAETVDARWLEAQVAFGPERTIEQDSTFAFRVIVDIAIKALSPAINDPTTAVLAIDQLQRLLRTVGTRDLHDEKISGDDGQLRVIFRTPNWSDFVHLTFSEIRQCGAGNFQIVRRLRAMIDHVMQYLPDSRQVALQRERDLLDRTVQKLYVFPEDLVLARIPDSQGLGGASDP
jgi:uncharacterized membrane protein